MNRTSAILLPCAALLAGVVITVIYLKTQSCEASPYVLDLHAVRFADPTSVNEPAFKAAIAFPQKAKFRHGMHLQMAPNGSVTQPSGYEDVGVICLLNSGGKPAGGLHVTQKVGFNNLADMQEALAHLQ